MSNNLATRNVFRKRRLALAAVPKAAKPVTKQQVKQMMQSKVELKYIDTITAGNTDYSGVIIPLSSIPQGVSDSQRIGDQVRLSRVLIKLKMQGPASNTPVSYRSILFRLNDFTSGPAAATYFTLNGGTTAPLGEVAWDYKHLVQVVSDKFSFVIGTSSSSARELDLTTLNIPLKGIVSYTAASTTNQENGLFLYLVTDLSNVNNAFYSVSSRVEYYDA